MVTASKITSTPPLPPPPHRSVDLDLSASSYRCAESQTIISPQTTTNHIYCYLPKPKTSRQTLPEEPTKLSATAIRRDESHASTLIYNRRNLACKYQIGILLLPPPHTHRSTPPTRRPLAVLHFCLTLGFSRVLALDPAISLQRDNTENLK